MQRGESILHSLMTTENHVIIIIFNTKISKVKIVNITTLYKNLRNISLKKERVNLFNLK